MRGGVAEAGSGCYGQGNDCYGSCEMSCYKEHCPNGIFRDCTGASGIDDGHCNGDTSGIYYANWTSNCPTTECCENINLNDDNDDDESIPEILFDSIMEFWKVTKDIVSGLWNHVF